jgi:Protein of unknown function DUF262
MAGMGFMPERSIASVLDSIYLHELMLPAIQREFVWSSNQVCLFFDSLLRDYPVGTMLTWHVPAAEVNKHVCYDFIREYHQKDHPHCPEINPPPHQPVIAVLDGQQRLTALNIGLRGSYAEKLPRLWWNNPAAYPQKFLYLDLAHLAPEEELGVRYDFRFLTPAEASSGTMKAGAIWFQVSDILPMKETYDLLTYLQGRGIGNDKHAGRALGRLHKVVHADRVVHYYQEDSPDIERVLNIFIRVNSGGTVLSYSDLLLSLATAQWKDRDARGAINDLIDELNSVGYGFNISKELVLKTGLMLLDKPDIRFKVRNFDRDTMQGLEAEWEHISACLRTAVSLLAAFGFSRETLAARSVIIPVAYYIHARELGPDYVTKDKHAGDRAQVRQWVVRSLLKRGIWGSGLDGLLTGLRAVLQKSHDAWPLEALNTEMSRRGKALRFQAAEIDDLSALEYGEARVFPLLALLYPGVNTTQQFHVDHIFPKSRFTKSKLKAAGVPDQLTDVYIRDANRIPNLQLLPGAANIAKQASLPVDWLTSHFSEDAQRQQWLLTYDATGLPPTLGDFGTFFDARRARLRARLEGLLGVEPAGGGGGAYETAAEIVDEAATLV